MSVTTQVESPNPPEQKKRTIGQKIKRFIDRNRMNFWISVSATLQLLIILFWYTPDIQINSLDKLVEEVAFIDSVSIKEPASEAPPEDGDFEATDKKKEEVKEDPRISGAQDSVISGATAPIDLNPSLKPDYTDEARTNGIEGTMTLEVIIADSGEVLQVRSVGRKLGAGLEESAIRTYRNKRFSPSILEGRPITVKVLIPIRFSLSQ